MKCYVRASPCRTFRRRNCPCLISTRAARCPPRQFHVIHRTLTQGTGRQRWCQVTHPWTSPWRGSSRWSLAQRQQGKHGLDDTMHLRVAGQAQRGVMDENHDETVTKIHPSQPRFTRAHASQDMSRAQSFPMYLQLAAHTHGCNSDALFVLTHPARCRRPRHRGFKGSLA
jgi:hypothetical protein